MQSVNIIEDEIILSFGKDFFDYADSIVSGVKDMRTEINAIANRDFSRIRIIDYDIDEEGNGIPILNNEILVRIKGKSVLNHHYDEIRPDTIASDIVKQLKNVILDYLPQIRDTF